MDRKGGGRLRSCLVVAAILVGLAGAIALTTRAHRQRTVIRRGLPRLSRSRRDAGQPTPEMARAFDYPLLPREAYGPYVHGVGGYRAIDTRFGVQNPALGSRSNCFRDRNGRPVDFSQLFHAGVDLFSLGPALQLLRNNAAGDPVYAVADGMVVATLNAGAEGQILITQHVLADQSLVYAVYWHVARLQVASGQTVTRGQAIASVYDQGPNSHLHWEMRTFLDGRDLFPQGTAGARGTCSGHVAGVGYTWDDVPDRARPEFYGYLDPIAFVEGHQ